MIASIAPVRRRHLSAVASAKEDGVSESFLCGIAIVSTPPMGSSILPPADRHFPLLSSRFMNSQYSSSDFFITASGTSNLLYSAIIIGLIVRSIAYFTSYFPASGQRIMPTDGFFAPSAICAIAQLHRPQFMQLATAQFHEATFPKCRLWKVRRRGHGRFFSPCWVITAPLRRRLL